MNKDSKNPKNVPNAVVQPPYQVGNLEMPSIFEGGHALHTLTEDPQVAIIFMTAFLTLYKAVIPILDCLPIQSFWTPLQAEQWIREFNRAASTYPDQKLLSKLLKDSWTIETVMATVRGSVVSDETMLNKHYKSFTSGVYGEVTMDSMASIVNQLNLNAKDVFVDMGSGIGQFVAYVAGATNVKKAVGIELHPFPAGIAKNLGEQFAATMKHCGKTIQPFEIHEGNFLDARFFDLITKEATVLFINNFCFDSKLIHQILELLKHCKSGTRIVTLRSLCELRTPQSKIYKECFDMYVDTGDFGSVKVSWSGKEYAVFIHTVNQSKAREFEAKIVDVSNNVNNSRKRSSGNDDEVEGKRMKVSDNAVASEAKKKESRKRSIDDVQPTAKKAKKDDSKAKESTPVETNATQIALKTPDTPENKNIQDQIEDNIEAIVEDYLQLEEMDQENDDAIDQGKNEEVERKIKERRAAREKRYKKEAIKNLRETILTPSPKTRALLKAKASAKNTLPAIRERKAKLEARMKIKQLYCKK